MEAAALALNVDSSSVVKAANDLDRFSAASDRAGKAGAGIGNQSGSIAKLVASLQSMDAKLSVIIGGLDKVNAGLAANAKASQGAAAANDNVARSIGAADAHVIAYTQHLAGLARAQQDANAHVLAYRNFLAGSAAPQQQLNSHVEAYRRNLATLPPAMDQASKSAGALQSNTGNIAAQFQDIGVTAAMGMSPLIIGLQQGTQLSAVFAQSGGSMKDALVGAFRQIASAQALLTIGLVALIAIAIQLAMAFFNSSSEADKLSKAIEKTQITTYALGDAQTALGNVFDLTTGKAKSQSEAMRGLARAQLEVIRTTALSDQSKARQTIAAQRGRNTPTMSTAPSMGIASPYGGVALSGYAPANQQQRLLDQFTSGKLNSTQAIDGMERLRKAGKLTEAQFISLTGAVASFGVAGENLKVYADARKALGGDKGALEQFLNRPKPTKPPKGPKTDAEKLADVYASANADIAAEKTRELAAASGVGAEEAARLEKQTAMLNAIQQKGIPITDAVRQKVADLSAEYAKAKVAADVTQAITNTTDEIEKQSAAVQDQIKLVGLYGDALTRAQREQDAQRKLRDSLPKGGDVVVMPNLTRGLSDDIEASNRMTRAAALRKASEDAAYAMNLERSGLGLTGAAAMQFAFVTDRLNQLKRDGIALTQEELLSINAAGKAYAEQRYAIDQQAQALADSRETARGFFTDLINGAREGGNVFQTFADSAINALNRIIDKLLDKALNGFLDNMFKGGLPKVASPFAGDGDISQLTPNALGGVYGSPTRFANGGAFTNQIVNTPTLFRFANGGQLGEMGEAGPEAIMPLKRGPNGSLGVQMHGGGRPSVRLGDYNPTFQLAGAIGLDGIAEVVRQGGEATYNQMKRDLQTLLQQLDTDGALTS